MPYKEFAISGIGTVKIYKRRGNRNLRLTITATGDIRITMPHWTPYQAGVAFVYTKRDWIISQSRNKQPLLNHGTSIGKSHRLIFIPSVKVNGTPKISVRQTEVIIAHSPDSDPRDSAVQAAARTASIRALRIQARTLLSQRLAQLANERGIRYKSLTIKQMKSRWGSCDQHKNIVLNLYLMQLPWHLIDYVILHELTHTKVLNHGTEFWREFEAFLPRAKELRRAIRTYRPALLTI